MMWGARVKAPSLEALRYTSSIAFDDRIALDVVRVNLAHLLMLFKQGIIGLEDAQRIYRSLRRMLKGVELREELEDVHMCVEDEVVRDVGLDVGGKLHTGKSRNDQVATALRMTAKRFCSQLALEVLGLQEALLSQSERHIDTVMPGYTHLQHAQPVTLAHQFLAYYDKLSRDVDRLLKVYERADESPMGSGALAGSSFNLDREYVAKLLGFSKIQENTTDAVSDRDFMVELAFASSMLMVHLSGLAEDLIIWSTWEYGFAEMPDAYSSTSSVMPQKKNPTVAEVVRARASHAIGMLTGSLTLLKALPLSYNLDLQELTPLVWQAVEVAMSSCRVMRGVVEGLQFDVKRMYDAAETGFSSATELANELVRRFNMPFRVAYRVAGRVVKEAVDMGLAPSDVSPEMLRRAARAEGYELEVDEELLKRALNPLNCVSSCRVLGGPSMESVKDMIDRRKSYIKSVVQKVLELKSRAEGVDEVLQAEAKRLGVA